MQKYELDYRKFHIFLSELKMLITSANETIVHVIISEDTLIFLGVNDIHNIAVCNAHKSNVEYVSYFDFVNNFFSIELGGLKNLISWEPMQRHEFPEKAMLVVYDNFVAIRRDNDEIHLPFIMSHYGALTSLSNVLARMRYLNTPKRAK